MKNQTALAGLAVVMVLGFAVFGSGARAADAPKPTESAATDLFTFGMWNGHMWKTGSMDTKLGFLIGINNGLRAESPTKLDDYFAAVSFGEVVLHVDRFYQDPANALIPVAYALMFVRQAMGGGDPEGIAMRVAAVRKACSAVEARTVKRTVKQ